MKSNIFCILLLCLLALLSGCAHNMAYRDVYNGVVRSEIHGEIGIFDSQVTSVSNDQMMPNCVAKTGAMPGGEELDLCVDQTRQDMDRRRRTLDLQSYPYYDNGYSY
ncbi:MAG: hypothetical protein ABII13_04465 [Patescibacteria group bacterium]